MQQTMNATKASRPSLRWCSRPFLTAGVVDLSAEGITVRGAKMLATGGVVANEVFVAPWAILSPGTYRSTTAA
jgi:aromatic ring hydroxylase